MSGHVLPLESSRRDRTPSRSRGFESFRCSALGGIQNIVQRLCWPRFGVLVRRRYREDSDVLVFRQREGRRIRRHIDRIYKQVGIGIRLIATGGIMTMRSKPSDVCALDKSRDGCQSTHRIHSGEPVGCRPLSEAPFCGIGSTVVFQIRSSHWPTKPVQSWTFKLTDLSPTLNSAF